jgi:hypothetical protein
MPLPQLALLESPRLLAAPVGALAQVQHLLHLVLLLGFEGAVVAVLVAEWLQEV